MIWHFQIKAHKDISKCLSSSWSVFIFISICIICIYKLFVFVSIFSPYTLFGILLFSIFHVLFCVLQILAALCWVTIWLFKIWDWRCSSIKKGCLIKWVVLSNRAKRLFIIAQLINCACSEKSAGAQTHKNRLTEIGFKARIDASKGVQARINDN